MKKDIKQGVLFDVRDYAGIGRRLVIVLVDFLVLVLGFMLLALLAAWVETVDDIFWVSCFILAFAYLGGLPATSHGTVGYIVTGVRLIDLYGNPAPLWRSCFRVGFLVFGPLNLLIDIIWLGGDPNRQSTRDKFAGTYVVRRAAVPTGYGPIRYKTYFMFNYNFMFREVERPDAEQVDGG